MGPYLRSGSNGVKYGTSNLVAPASHRNSQLPTRGFCCRLSVLSSTHTRRFLDSSTILSDQVESGGVENDGFVVSHRFSRDLSEASHASHHLCPVPSTVSNHNRSPSALLPSQPSATESFASPAPHVLPNNPTAAQTPPCAASASPPQNTYNNAAHNNAACTPNAPSAPPSHKVLSAPRSRPFPSSPHLRATPPSSRTSSPQSALSPRQPSSSPASAPSTNSTSPTPPSTPRYCTSGSRAARSHMVKTWPWQASLCHRRRGI